MTRSLEGKWFHNFYNNGVEAIVTHEVWENMRKKRAVMLMLENMSKRNGDQEDMLPHIPDTPVFTFASKERVDKSPWFTGTMSNTSSFPENRDLTRLLNYITRNGGQFGSGSFHVPFSNGAEIGFHGPDAQVDELRYVTTSQQFEETFGISMNELRNSGDKYL